MSSLGYYDHNNFRSELYNVVRPLPLFKRNWRFINTMLKILTSNHPVKLDTSNLGDNKSWNGVLRFNTKGCCNYHLSQCVIMPMVCAAKPDSIDIEEDSVTFKWAEFLA